jgi:MFS family permease
MQWFQVLSQQWRFLFFGLIFTVSSSLGQTFFISLFIPSITSDYSLTTTDFANYYALITLGSALLLPAIGRWIDKVDLLTYAGGVCLTMLGATSLIYLDLGPVGLIFSILLIRLCGQGLMSHTALTSLARYFTKQRGRILAIVSMGHPISESFMPILGLTLIQSWGWRSTYLFFGIIVAVVFFPLAFLLVRNQQSFRKLPEIAETFSPNAQHSENTQKKFLKKSLILPSIALAPSFVAVPMLATALIFHQSTMASLFNLELATFAQAFMFFALFQILCTFITGGLIDRFGAQKVYPLHLLALALTLIYLNGLSEARDVYIYLAMLGASAGLGSTTKTALVAELVPPQFLGRAKSLATSLMVFSTALGPAVLSNSLDLGLKFSYFNIFCAIFCLASLILAKLSFRSFNKQYS